MTKRKILYVAAPYTHPDPVENTHRVIKAASIIYDRGPWTPFVPHLTLLWHAIEPHHVNWWYDYDLDHLRNCQGFVRFPGLSTGADNEEREAKHFGLEIVEFDDLPLAAQSCWLGAL